MLGLDTDPWLRSYRRSVQAYGTVADTLEFYRRIFLESPVAIIVTTISLQIADANIAAQKMLNMRLKQLRGRRFHSHVARADREAFTAIVADLRDGRNSVSRPVLLNTTGGVEMEAMLNASVIRTAKGEPEFLLLVLHDRGDDVSSDMV